MKKFVAMFLVFSILFLYGNMYAKQKRGAILAVQKKAGAQVKGELIAVKEDSLLLKGAESGVDVTVYIKEIKVVTIVKKSKAGAGILLGGTLGGVMGAAAYGEPDNAFIDFRGIVVLGSAILGVIFGGIIGALAGNDKTYQIEGKSESEINRILYGLRQKARIANFQ